MTSHVKVKVTLEQLRAGSSATVHGWRYAILDVRPGGYYPNREGRPVRETKHVTVLYEWSPAGTLEVVCRTARTTDAEV